MAATSSASDTDPTLWYGVTDPKARKRIQDRLAQRARRKRLSEAAKQSGPGSATPAAKSVTTKQKIARQKINTTDKAPSCRKTAKDKSVDEKQVTAICSGSPPASCDDVSTESSTASNGKSPGTALVKSCPKTEYIYLTCCANLEAIRSATSPAAHSLPHKIDWIMAIEICGMVLGIAGCNLGHTRSSRQLNIPDALQPSPLQLSTPHDLWIDKLPFPRLRDNLILLSSCIDIEEFLQDGIQMQAFALDQGAMPWDPKKWRMKPEFRVKWGYLFN